MSGTPRIGRSVFAPDSHEPPARLLPREPLTRKRVRVLQAALALDPVNDTSGASKSLGSPPSGPRNRDSGASRGPVSRPSVKYPRRRPCLRCDRPFKSTHKLHRLCDFCRSSNTRAVELYALGTQ